MALKCGNCPILKNQKCQCEYCNYTDPGDDGTGNGIPNSNTSIRKNTFKQHGIRGDIISRLTDVVEWNDAEIKYALNKIRREFSRRSALSTKKSRVIRRASQKKKIEN